MKLSAVFAVAVLASACTAVEVVEVPAGPKITFKDPQDPAASILIKCLDLGFEPGTDAHALCILRGVDRLQPTAVHELQLPRAAPIQILPNAFPALVPGNTLFVSPIK